jgi:very-short-patch-repair endonuclease
MTAHARVLRNGMTDAEKRLWLRLRADQLGVRFRRQLVIERRFIVDFCAPEAGLVVEVDGGQHAESATDALRTAFLEARGYHVLRFWNPEVLRDTDGVVQVIAETLAALRDAKTSPPAPLRNGEGGASRGAAPVPQPDSLR